MDSLPIPTQHATATGDDFNDDDRNHGRPTALTWGQKPTSIPSGAPSWLTSISVETNTPKATESTTPHSETGPHTYPPASILTVWASGPDDAQGGSPSAVPTIEGGAMDGPGEMYRTNRAAIYTAAGVVPVVVLGIVGALIFFCLRKRKKQRQISQAQAQIEEKAKFEQPSVQAYRAPVEPVPMPVSRSPWYTSVSGDAPAPAAPSPVILGPISAGSNGNYMTGIDTSDVLSTRNDRTGLGDPFADGNSLLEEPPPPYKPRSLNSRNNSIRMHRSSLSRSSQSSAPSYATRVKSLRNPFEDPKEDDDAVSQLSGSMLNRNHDDMSVVSDLSYQQDPHVGRGVS